MEQSLEIALKFKQALDEQAEQVIQWAEEALPEARVKRLQGTFLSQLNNALGVAQQTQSPRVVSNWIAYQMGRKETRTNWGESGLGAQILQHFQKMDEMLAPGLTRQIYGDDSAEHRQSVQIRLVRQYLGFLKRWFVAKGGQR